MGLNLDLVPSLSYIKIHTRRSTDSVSYFPEKVWENQVKNNGDCSSNRSTFAFPILLLAMDFPTNMGCSVWKRAWPMQSDGLCCSFPEADSVSLSLFRLNLLLASPSLLLAPHCLWSVPKLQVRIIFLLLTLIYIHHSCVHTLDCCCIRI